MARKKLAAIVAVAALFLGVPGSQVQGSALTLGVPVALFTGAGGAIVAERISILRGWLGPDDKFSLMCTLTDSKGVLLGAHTFPMSSVSVVFEEKAEAQVDVDWTGMAGVPAVDTEVDACVQVLLHLGSGEDKLFGDTECRNLIPSQL